MTGGGPVAFVVDARGRWVEATRFANRLLRQGYRVLIATADHADGAGRPAVEPGSFVIPLSPAADAGLDQAPDAAAIAAMAEEVGLDLGTLAPADRVLARPLSVMRVGLYGGGGAPFNQAGILAVCGFPIRFISDAQVRAGELAEVDVLVVPGGGFRAMVGQIEPLGEEGCRAIADFVRRGGMYIGSCAGSYDCAITPEEFVRSCPAQRHLQLINARVWNDASIDFGALQSPGVGVVRVRNERPDHPVMFGMPDGFDVAHYNGPIFDPVPPPAIDGASAAVGLASFAGWTERFTPAEGFSGPIDAREPTLLERAIEAERYSAVAGYLGQGRVVAFGSHPEFGFDLAMVQWGEPARMLSNAVLWQAAAVPVPAQRGEVDVRLSLVAFPAGSAFDKAIRAAHEVRHWAGRVAERGLDPAPFWIEPEYALSLFGQGPVAIWHQALTDIETMASEFGAAAGQLRNRVQGLLAARGEVELDPDVLAAIAMIERWVLDERPPEWQQDGGYQGIVALLKTAATMCQQALANWDEELGPPAGAYAYLHDNPYHLVAGSYLAAVGCVAGAAQLIQAAAAELAMAEAVAADRMAAERREVGTPVGR